jgi:integrase
MAIGQVKLNAKRGVYQAEYRDCAGKRRYVSDKKQKECLRKLREAEREVHQGIHIAASQTVTFGVALDAFIKESERRHRNKEITGQTLTEYRGVAERHVRPTLGKVKLNKLTTRLCQDLINELSDRYRTTHESARKVISQTLQFAVERDWLRRSPLTDRKLRVPRRRDPITIPDKQDLRALVEVVMRTPSHGEHKLVHAVRRVVVMLGLFCGGMRKGEMAGLHWEDIDWVNSVISIRRAYSSCDGLKGPKTRSSVRDVTMISPVREALEHLWQLMGRPGEGFVIVTERGNPAYSSIGSNYWAPIMKAAGLIDEKGKPKFTPHALRHAYVSSLAEAGVPLLEISRRVGHSALDMTVGIYSHLFRDAEDRASPAIESVYQSLVRPPVAQICDHSTQEAEIINS